MTAYYNEIDPYAAQWLRNLIAAGHIAPGDVDERSIADVRPDDVRGYAQCHFFAGIGGWSLALRLAGWDDDRPVWSGSCPCQPFSAAGQGKAADDERHLWPQWFSLIRECRPAIVFGEQVEAAIGWGWLDAVFSDLEAEGYACGASVLPACSVGAPHIRQRLWFVGQSDCTGSQSRREATTSNGHWRSAIAASGDGELADADKFGTKSSIGQPGRTRAQEREGVIGRGISRELADAVPAGRPEGRPIAGDGSVAGGSLDMRGLANPASEQVGLPGQSRPLGDAASVQPEQLAGQWTRPGETESGRPCGEPTGSGHNPWSDLVWLPCTDGKARPTKPGIFPLAHGVSARVGKLRAAGNAIVAPVAAEFVKAAMNDAGMFAQVAAE